jgi:hypothetical protein
MLRPLSRSERPRPPRRDLDLGHVNRLSLIEKDLMLPPNLCAVAALFPLECATAEMRWSSSLLVSYQTWHRARGSDLLRLL